MSAPSTTTERPAEERAVFAPTLPSLAGQLCDACGDGSAVPASYQANKGDKNLFFCAHPIRKSAEKLSTQGFTFWPEDISFDAGTKKVEPIK